MRHTEHELASALSQLARPQRHHAVGGSDGGLTELDSKEPRRETSHELLRGAMDSERAAGGDGDGGGGGDGDGDGSGVSGRAGPSAQHAIDRATVANGATKAAAARGVARHDDQRGAAETGIGIGHRAVGSSAHLVTHGDTW